MCSNCCGTGCYQCGQRYRRQTTPEDLRVWINDYETNPALDPDGLLRERFRSMLADFEDHEHDRADHHMERP